MRVQEDAYDVGVLVGRFQVPELHKAHKDLIRTVCERHDKVIIFLGVSPLWATKENPLDFEARKQMILQEFPEVNVVYINDMATDEAWSKRLDEQIGYLVTPAQSVVLYGSRDSFISHYHGRFPTAELIQEVYVSGTEIRKAISRKSVKADPAFRAGAIWASQARYPTTFPTVDVAIFNEDESKILLARKEHEREYRLIGGFAEPESDSFEQDARREVREEAGVEITDPEYVASFKVDDWRYRSEPDKIKTLLFKARVASGSPRPDDDIIEVRWFEVSEIKLKDIRPEHREMMAKLIGLA